MTPNTAWSPYPTGHVLVPSPGERAFHAAIVEYNLLSPRDAEFLRKLASREVDGATRRIWHDQAHRFIRIRCALRVCSRPEKRSRCYEEHAK